MRDNERIILKSFITSEISRRERELKQTKDKGERKMINYDLANLKSIRDIIIRIYFKPIGERVSDY